MDLVSFKKLRNESLNKNDFKRARELEEKFLSDHPKHVEVLLMSEWTSRALQLNHDAMIFRNLAAFSFGAQQEKLHQEIIHRNHKILSAIFGDHFECASPTLLFTQKIIFRQIIDEAWGWFQLVNPIIKSGEIAQIDGFGKYRIQDPNVVIEKRLSRRMPWEAALNAFIIECSMMVEKDALIVDIGANIGCTSIPVAIHHGGQVVAFEPLEKNYDMLSENISLNGISNLKAFQLALGSQEGSALMADGPSNNPGMAHIACAGESSKEVKMVTLDSALANSNIGLIKIDVEGYEHQVLQGAKRILKESKPVIVVELLGGKGSEETHSLLVELGYSCLRLSRSDHVYFAGKV